MMENIGKKLKERRTELGKTLEEINQQTKITLEHLKLLEKNDFTFLPPTYVKSFIRNYAKALDLEDHELINEFDQAQEQERRYEKELEEKAEIEAEQSQFKQKVIEWALGAGSLILLISLILVYIEYKSQLHAQPVDNFLKKIYDVAEIVVQKQQAAEANTKDDMIELEITAKDRLWLRLTIDNKKFSEHVLSPMEQKSWKAENRFEIVFGEWSAEKQHRKSSTERASADQEIHLSFTKSALAKPDKK